MRYDELAPMLLNEVRQLRQQLRAVTQMNASMQAAILKLQARDERPDKR